MQDFAQQMLFILTILLITGLRFISAQITLFKQGYNLLVANNHNMFQINMAICMAL